MDFVLATLDIISAQLTFGKVRPCFSISAMMYEPRLAQMPKFLLALIAVGIAVLIAALVIAAFWL